MSNTHSEFIVIEWPDGTYSKAIQSGIPDECEHDWLDPYFETRKGKQIYWYTFKDLIHLPHNSFEWNYLVQKRVIDMGDSISFGGSQCRKCKKTNYPSMMDEIFWVE